MRTLRLLLVAALLVVTSMTTADARPVTWSTHLTGDQEVPSVDTNATGQLILRASADGTSVDYRLIVANIDDVFMAHLHLAPSGANGGVVAWVYPEAPPPMLLDGRSSGVLATGTLTDDDLVGALAGGTIDDLVAAIEDSMIYVNVHTSAHPGGELRGQVG